MKKSLIALTLFICSSLHLQAQDFKIEGFQENMTDLTAAMAGVKDLNQKEAALLRFIVRDNKFEFEPNLGILRQEDVTGEIRLYVPEGTKRITVRHPQLGVLRDYTIPIPIRSKVTYDAEIVITNSDYLQALFGIGFDNSLNKPEFAEKPTVVNPIEPIISEPIIEQPIVEESPVEEPLAEEPATEEPIVEAPVVVEPIQKEPEEEPTLWEPEQEQPNVVASSNKPKGGAHVFGGLGFNAVSAMGPSLHLGFGYRAAFLEAGYVFGLDKVKDISFTIKGDANVSEAYDYSCSKFWLRVGYTSTKKSSFKVSPMAGVTFNMISGSSKGGGTSYFKKSTPMAISLSLRFSYEVVKSLRIHVTPQYDFALSGDDVYNVIKTADNKIKAWGEGFGINAGLLYNF